MPQKKTGPRSDSKPKAKAQSRPRRSKPAAGEQVRPAEPTREMIAKRAYEIWLKNIRRAYQPAQDWIEAEAQLRAELKKKPARARKAAGTTSPAKSPVWPAPEPDERLAA